MLTPEKIREVFGYDPATGIITWRTPIRRVPVGSVAGSVNSAGYIQVKYRGKLYKAHRIAWVFMNGFWPPDEVDHVNRNRTDNRICNLRCASRHENRQNVSVRIDNTSGCTGVHWNSVVGKWQARIWVAGRQIHLGYFKELSQAIEARHRGKRQHHCFNPVASAP